MALTRRLILVLLLVALLPWGAYASAFRAMAGRSDDPTAPHAEMVSWSDRAAAADMRLMKPAAKSSFALAPRKCRTATLPGLTCVSDPGFLQRATDLTASQGQARVQPEADWTGTGASEAPPTAPPRSV